MNDEKKGLLLVAVLFVFQSVGGFGLTRHVYRYHCPNVFSVLTTKDQNLNNEGTKDDEGQS